MKAAICKKWAYSIARSSIYKQIKAAKISNQGGFSGTVKLKENAATYMHFNSEMADF
jgi:hypothetical protein